MSKLKMVSVGLTVALLIAYFGFGKELLSYGTLLVFLLVEEVYNLVESKEK